MKSFVLCTLFAFTLLGNNNAQVCIDTVANSLTLLSKTNVGGSECVFGVKFCIRKTSDKADSVEYAVFHTNGQQLKKVNVAGYQTGSVICEIFLFVANCNSTASFVAVGREVNGSICGVVADLILLPIRLLNFSTEPQSSGATLLKWETATESNASHFIIQQSKDARNFTDIGKVKAAGDSKILQSYQFTVPGSTISTSQQNLYYRLKMMDRDGSFNYSQIIKSLNTNKNKFDVYPNPSSSILKINIEDLQKENLKLMDLNGKEITAYWEDNITLNVSSLLPGIYLIKYQNDVIRFVKN